MDEVATKILIIFGLLVLTLVAALLPLFCLKLTTRYKRRSLKRQSVSSSSSCCSSNSYCSCFGTNSTLNYQEKPALPNGRGSFSSSFDFSRIRFRKKLLVSSLNCFAGGIFLGTSFIGLLPEIRKGFDIYNITWPDLTSGNGTESKDEAASKMPLAEIIVVLGLFFILSVEQAAHSFNHWRLKHGHKSSEKIVLQVSGGHSVENGRGHLLSSPSFSDASVVKPSHDHTGIRSLMLVATLSAHSLLEGIAIGVEDNLGNLLVIFIGVLFHKSLMAFSMGSSLVHSKQSVKRTVAASFIFAVASPIGIGIGMAIQQSGGSNEGSGGAMLVTNVLQAIATGTFLYITFFEVLVKEFEGHGHRFAKILSLFLGFGSVLLTFFFAHH